MSASGRTMLVTEYCANGNLRMALNMPATEYSWYRRYDSGMYHQHVPKATSDSLEFQRHGNALISIVMASGLDVQPVRLCQALPCCLLHAAMQ